ncbi:hypothetical protein [Aurantibacter sp.]|uniref:hypothetical protein n=1 Tax=Aurantibacter sp. TaxID=2807103 RepID=UPI0035C859D4
MKTLNELLCSNGFREKTKLYIGSDSILTLRTFLDGFYDFVVNYYNYFESTSGWSNIILKESDGNEQKAIKQFFVLYDLFKINPSYNPQEE